MGVKKFIQDVIDTVKLKDFEEKSKKKSLKTLLSKLKKRRLKIFKELQQDKTEEELAQLNEKLQLISLHIKNGKEKLNALKKSSKKD